MQSSTFRRRLFIPAFAIAALSVMLLAGMRWREPPLFQQGTYVFGTRANLTIYGADDFQALQASNAVFARFGQLHHQLHAWQPSELTRLNAAIAAGRPFHASARLAAILRQARLLSLQSRGLFDPGIGRQIKLWGFQSDTFGQPLPGRAAIFAQLDLHPSLVDLNIAPDGTVSSDNRAVAVDLGGYAKGWALDEAAEILRGKGIRNALIDVGGNLMALGSKGGQPWRVGIQNPRKPEALAAIDLADGEAIGTSGDYYRYYKAGGIRYCHIIDPRNGAPSRASQAVTVLADPGPHAGALSDGASKPPFIAGPGAALALGQKMGVSKLLLVDAAGRVWVSPEMAKRITWVDHAVHPQLLADSAGADAAALR